MTALVLRHDLLHDADDGHIVESARFLEESLLIGTSRIIIILTDFRHHDLRIGGRDGLLFVVEHLFIEFLAVTKSRKLDFHILRSRKGYHTLGQIDDLHRLAHIEDEDLAALAHGSGLKHELAGFRNQHEVTDDVRMGDGDRSTAPDLFLEYRNHTAVRAENVSESGSDELCNALNLTVFDGLVETLAVYLADTLAAAP